MFIAMIYRHAGSAAIDRVSGGFASNDEAFERCARNVPAQRFDVREVEHYEGLD